MRTEEMGRNAMFKTMWWKVDLGGLHNIFSIDILFKNYDGYGMLVYVVLSVSYQCARNIIGLICFLDVHNTIY